MFGWTPTVPRPQDGGATDTDWPGLARARTHAARRGDRVVGTQHLLLALLSEPGGEVHGVLAEAGVDCGSVEDALAGIQGSGAFVAPVGVDQVRLSSRASTVLTAAAPRDGGRATTDRDVLATLLDSDEPSVGRLILRYIGARGRLRDALTRR